VKCFHQIEIFLIIDKFWVLIFWHHFGYLDTTLRLGWHPLAKWGKKTSLTPSLAPIRANTCCKRARISEKRSFTSHLCRSLIYVDHSPALITQLRRIFSCIDHSAAIHKKAVSYNSHEKAVLIQLRWKSRFHSTQVKKSFSFNSGEKRIHSTQAKKPYSFNSFLKAVLIQLRWKSRFHSTQVKKPSQFNSGEKAVLIQLSEKPSSFNSGEKAVFIQLRWKSRSHPTQVKKPFSLNWGEKAVLRWKSLSHSTHL
jgi:hypothetical protein